MAAKHKQELIDVSEKEFTKLQKLLADIDEELALTPHPEDGITIKDTIAHRVHWNGLFFGWYENGVAGKPVHVPAEGYGWGQLKAYNAKVREETAGVTWAEAKRALLDGHERLVKFVDDHDERDLYGPKQYDWQGKYPMGRWVESTGPSHYRSAVKYIREVRRKLGRGGEPGCC